MKNSAFPDFNAAVDAAGPDRPVLIAGCTASGKSSLALDIAETHGGVIVNADAMQVYENWSVLTARPPVEDLARAPHALYGHVAGNRAYTVGDWLRDIEPYVHGASRPIIVGGTGLFFRALTEGLADIPPIDDAVTDMARNANMEDLLLDLDADTCAHLDTQNPARVQRAWAVQRQTGQSIIQWHAETPAPLVPLDTCLPIHLDADPAWLKPRIEQRFDIMLNTGALDEAERNLPDWDPTQLSSKAIGAPELIGYLQGNMDLDTAREKSIIATRQYAKRQRTWFRKRMHDWVKISLS